jgi:hypothetical protein
MFPDFFTGQGEGIPLCIVDFHVTGVSYDNSISQKLENLEKSFPFAEISDRRLLYPGGTSRYNGSKTASTLEPFYTMSPSDYSRVLEDGLQCFPNGSNRPDLEPWRGQWACTQILWR